jgi:hypothetical protein
MRRRLILLAVVVPSIIICYPFHAISLTFSLDVRYEGQAIPGGPSPWLSAKLEDIGVNRVRFTLSAFGLLSDEYVGAWSFNLDPTLPLPGSDYISGSIAEITTGQNSITAGAETGFDIGFIFTDKFGVNQSAVYDFFLPAGSGNLLASSFNFVNFGGSFFSAAQVLGPDSAFAWIADAQDDGPGPAPVPEPATMLLLGAGSIGMAFFGRKKLKK